jgi:formiminotetrahydrofolate cyclodeaminase
MATKPFKDLIEKVLTPKEIEQIEKEALEEYKKIIKKAAKLPNFSDEELGRRMKEFQKE